ncbi:MAG: helix-turn-helix transcriptional regulator [Clostridiales bacterium]|nr:helix-turn-helix transcriptional regulator [Candidatus Crickella equi]
MFKDRIKTLRKQAGLTQERFAKDFGISTGTVAMWETGKRNPSYEMMLKLAEYFCVNLAELEEERENLEHNITEAAPFLDNMYQMYDAEHFATTYLSLPDEDRKEIEALVYSKAKTAKAEHSLKDVRNIFVDIRFYPEPDDDDPLMHRKSAQEDFAEV